MKNNKVVAMLLAGGQGSRLKELTKEIAKPAVTFGGKYRIVDFALSNVSNSGISDIGILTQYKPLVLNDHIGNGVSWQLDRSFGGLQILSPFKDEFEGRWYKGTANAIYENMHYIESINPQYVLILSGDHIYKMNYSKMIDEHIKNDADGTISVIRVPWEEASRFGIMDTDKKGRIVEFEEKPDLPKNNLASMGIYVFNWKELKEYLIRVEEDPQSNDDFGKDIIPQMIENGKRMFAYEFNGYWKDVGTVRSYWQANMDLLDEDNELDIYDKNWRIRTRNRHMPPHYLTETSEVENSMINEGCVIEGKISNCILAQNIYVEKNAQVENSVILSNTMIKSGAKVRNAVIMEDLIIESNAEIGLDDKISLISKEHILYE